MVEVVFGIVVDVAVGAMVEVEIDCVVDNTVVVWVDFGIKVVENFDDPIVASGGGLDVTDAEVDHKVVFVFDVGTSRCVVVGSTVDVSVLVFKVVVDAVVDAVVDVSVLIGK